MQIAPVLSYLPYVARPSESTGATAIASSARSGGSTQASAHQVIGVQPAPTDDSSDARAPRATESTTRAEGNEASTAKNASPAGDGAQRAGREKTDSDQQAESNASQDPTAPKGANGQTLTPEDMAVLKDLQVRDREVRSHELAHQVVGGQYAGGASYTFERGPDGGRYAVAGEVPIDVGAIPGDPQATIEKMRQVRAAALAPAEPSAQDRAIAAQASQTMMAAQLELALQRRESVSGKDASKEDTAASPLINATQSADEKSSATRAEPIRAIQAYDSMAPGLYRNAFAADALWAMA